MGLPISFNKTDKIHLRNKRNEIGNAVVIDLHKTFQLSSTRYFYMKHKVC